MLCGFVTSNELLRTLIISLSASLDSVSKPSSTKIALSLTTPFGTSCMSSSPYKIACRITQFPDQIVQQWPEVEWFIPYYGRKNPFVINSRLLKKPTKSSLIEWFLLINEALTLKIQLLNVLSVGTPSFTYSFSDARSTLRQLQLAICLHLVPKVPLPKVYHWLFLLNNIRLISF